MTEPTTEAAAEAAPTCYRHPGRETWVRCTRCERPICPDCMNEAAVGFQCPECVREGNRTLRERRNVFGGRVTGDATVTKVLVAVNALVFLVQLASPEFTRRFAMTSVLVAERGEYHRLLTAAFLHSPDFLLHIAFNTYALLLFGGAVEQRLGRARFVTVYLISALGGSTLSYLLHSPLEVSPNGGVSAFSAVGASGAIFGLFGAYFVIARRLRADTSQIVALIAINLAIGFALGGAIDNWAHLGGLATGALVTAALALVPPGPRRTPLQAVACVLVAIVLVGLVVIRTDNLRSQCVAQGGIVSCVRAAAAPAR